MQADVILLNELVVPVDVVHLAVVIIVAADIILVVIWLRFSQACVCLGL